MQPLPEDGVYNLFSSQNISESVRSSSQRKPRGRGWGGGGSVQQNFIYILIFLNKASRVSSEFLKHLRSVQTFKVLLREHSHLFFHPGLFCSVKSIPETLFCKQINTNLPALLTEQPGSKPPVVPLAKTKSELTL